MSNFDYAGLKVPADYGDHRGTAMGRSLTAAEMDADLKAIIDHGDVEHVHQDDIGSVSIDLTSLSSRTLTIAEAKKGLIYFTGALSANCTVTFPTGTQKMIAIFNQTTGSRNLVIKAGAGTGLFATIYPAADNLVLVAVDAANANARSWGVSDMGKNISVLTSNNAAWVASKSYATVLLIGGGGGGGGAQATLEGVGGGGGAGGVRRFRVALVPGSSYNIVIAATAAGGSGSNKGTPGNNSSAFGVTAYGGGGGGYGANNGSGGGGGSAGYGGKGGDGGNGSGAAGAAGVAGIGGTLEGLSGYAGSVGTVGGNPVGGGGGGATGAGGAAPTGGVGCSPSQLDLIALIEATVPAGTNTTNAVHKGGTGGSCYGAGGAGNAADNAAGVAGAGYGSGGGGANRTTAGTATGGDGAPGLCVIVEE